jgi:hypothetical protein
MVVNKASDLGRHVCKMSSKSCSICGLKNLKPAGLIKHLEVTTVDKFFVETVDGGITFGGGTGLLAVLLSVFSSPFINTPCVAAI